MSRRSEIMPQVGRRPVLQNCLLTELQVDGEYQRSTENKSSIIDVIVCKLRARFKAVDADFDALITHWGEGYRWKHIDAAPVPIVDRDDALRERLRRHA